VTKCSTPRSAEDQPDLQVRAAFEVIAPQTANAQAGMAMGFAEPGLNESITWAILAKTGFGQPADVFAKPR
jgi:hypothetical protein